MEQPRQTSEKEARAIELVLEMGRTLHRYGAPAHRLEDAMSETSRHLGLDGQFFTTPTSIMAAFGPLGTQHAKLLRVQPGDVDLEKLAALDELADALEKGRIDPEEGLAQVRAIDGAPPRYRPWVGVAASGLASATAARFFGGGLAEILCAFGIGLMIGTLGLLLRFLPRSARVFELGAAMAASLVAGLSAAFIAPLSVYVATLAGLILLVPGLTLTVAMTELATRHYVSGSARLTAAGIVFLEIIFGVALGGAIATALTGQSPGLNEPVPLPAWTLAPALAISALALTVLFRARPAALGWIVFSCTLSFWGARGGALLLGPELGVMLGSLLLGVAGSLYTRLVGRPAAEPMLPGLLLLVPGSLGFKSLSSFLGGDAAAGVGSAFSMVMVALGIVAGLLVANAALPARRAL